MVDLDPSQHRQTRTYSLVFPSSLPLQVVYFGDSMRSDMFPASSFAKWETVMIAEEMEGEGVAKSDAALNNEAQVEPLEKKGKFEVSLAAVSALRWTTLASKQLPLHFLYTTSLLPVDSLRLTS